MRTLHLSHGSAQASDLGRAAGVISTPLSMWSRRALGWLSVWRARARERRQLRELSDALLHDLGLSRSDVDAEAMKPFWRP